MKKSSQYDEMQGNELDIRNHPDVNLPSFPYQIWGGAASPPAISGQSFPKGTPDLNKEKRIKQPGGLLSPESDQ